MNSKTLRFLIVALAITALVCAWVMWRSFHGRERRTVSRAVTQPRSIPEIQGKRRSPEPAYACILTYHKIADRPAVFTVLPPDKFREQMQYLADNGFNVVPLSAVVQSAYGRGRLPPKAVAITFDDGYATTYSQAYPVLKEHGFPATLFVYTRWIGRSRSALTWEQLRHMQRSGLIDIQSHTVSHPRLPSLDANRLVSELGKSKDLIESKIGSNAEILAYPYGYYDRRVMKAVGQSGYHAALTVDEAPAVLDSAHALRLCRQVIDRDDALSDFINKVTAKPLRLKNEYPADGEVVHTLQPVIQAVISQDVIPSSVQMRILRKTADCVYNRHSQRLSYQPAKPLPATCINVCISAHDRSGSLRQAAWSFRVEARRPAKHRLG